MDRAQELTRLLADIRTKRPRSNHRGLFGFGPPMSALGPSGILHCDSPR